MNFTVGNHVSMLRWNADYEPRYEPLGKVMGFGTSNGQPVVLVELDNPVWAEGREYFISVLMVHPTNLNFTRYEEFSE